MTQRSDTPRDGGPRSVVVVSAVVPYPEDAGKKKVLAGILAYWIQQVGADSVHYVLIGSEDDDTSAIPVQTHLIRRPSSLEQATSVVRRTVIGRRHALQESTLYAPRVRERLGAVLNEIAADVEIFDTVRMGQYAEAITARPGTRRIVYLDDLFSVRYQRMLDVMAQFDDVDIDPLGDFRRMLPSPAVRLAGRPRVRRALLRWERDLIARRERSAAHLFDAALLVSPHEVATLARQVPEGVVRELPPILTAPPWNRRPSERPTFVLLGLLTLGHNSDAARVFLDTCMPGALERMPDLLVHIVGRGAPEDVVESAARYGDAVRVEGYTEDLDALFASAHALVVPMRYGSGIKIKVLESLARGLPVISTSIGAEGIRSGKEHGVLVEDDPLRFAPLMAEVLDDDVNASLSRSAREHYEAHYSPQAGFRRYDTAFER